MEVLFRISLVIAGVINLLPSILAFLPKRISSSYGIAVPDANYELLLRHRAVLFGIIGGIMLYAAYSQTHYSLAVIIGLVSMVSFVALLQLVPGEVNPQLRKVMKVDVFAIVILLAGYTLYAFAR